jgi:hypothetical protein
LVNKKLDDIYNMARTNILRKTKSPQLKNLLEAWWRSTDEQDASRHEEATGEDKAVTAQS